MADPYISPGTVDHAGRFYGVLDLRGISAELWLDACAGRAGTIGRAGPVLPLANDGTLDTCWQVHDDNNDGVVSVRARATDVDAPFALLVDTDGAVIPFDPAPADDQEVGAPGTSWKTLVVRRAWTHHGRGQLTLSTGSTSVTGDGTTFTRMAAASEFGTGLLSKPTRIRILTGDNAGIYSVATITSDTVLALSSAAVADQTVAPDEWEEIASYLNAGLTPAVDQAFWRMVPEFELVAQTDTPDPGDYVLADCKRQIPPGITIIVDRRAENRFQPIPMPTEVFTTLHGAAQVLREGDAALVDERWGTGAPGTVYATLPSSSGEGAYATACSGRSVVITTWDATTAHCKSYDRDLDAANVHRTYTLSPNNAEPLRVATDGTYVVIIVGSTVQCFDHEAGGSALWSYDHGGDLHDVCIGLGQVYIAGEAGGGGYHARALDVTDGTVDASYDHGGDLYSCCTDGLRLWVGGDAGTGAATLRCLLAATLSDSDNTAWSSTTAEACTVGGQLAAQDGHVYQAAGTARLLDKYDALGGLIGSYALPSGVSVSNYVVADHEYVYVLSNVNPTAPFTPILYCFSPASMSVAWAWVGTPGGVNALIPAADGGAIYLPLHCTTGGADMVHQLVRNNRPRPVRRADPQTTYGAQRQHVVF